MLGFISGQWNCLIKCCTNVVHEQHQVPTSYSGIIDKTKLKRWRKYKDSMLKKPPENSTTLSTYFWKETEEGRNPKVEWKILESNIPTFSSVTKKCRLCLREKFTIAFKPDLAIINSRNKKNCHCRHIQACLIEQSPD